MKKAFITGITGQDGSYLAEFLLKNNYEVHGLVRRAAIEDTKHRFSRINHIKDKIKLHSGDISNYERIIDVISKIKPDEVYHLAAQSFVAESFEDPSTTIMMNIQGTLNVLNAIRNTSPKSKLYFAGSSEMFGKVRESPQNENTPFYPRSPYGVSKVTGFELTRNFRESYGLFACSGILFNHESSRRGFEFVTRKITSGLAEAKKGKSNILALGNLEAKRDWGFAGDYVEAMHLMMQQPNPEDYVIATGENHSIKEFIDIAANITDVKYCLVDLHKMSNEEANVEIEKLKKLGQIFVIQHPLYYRPAEVNELLGDPSKARKNLSWQRKTSFEDLIKIMVEHDLEYS